MFLDRAAAWNYGSMHEACVSIDRLDIAERPKINWTKDWCPMSDHRKTQVFHDEEMATSGGTRECFRKRA
jgi:hypothetical protein